MNLEGRWPAHIQLPLDLDVLQADADKEAWSSHCARCLAHFSSRCEASNCPVKLEALSDLHLSLSRPFQLNYLSIANFVSRLEENLPVLDLRYARSPVEGAGFCPLDTEAPLSPTSKPFPSISHRSSMQALHRSFVQISPFDRISLTLRLHVYSCIPIVVDPGYVILTNETETVAFLCLPIAKGSCPYLQQLLECIDKVLRDFNLPQYHKVRSWSSSLPCFAQSFPY